MGASGMTEASTAAPKGREIARVFTYEGLQAFTRARADVLGIRRSEIDQVAQLAPGYAGTVLAPVPDKKMGWDTVFQILETLGLCMVLQHDQRALDFTKQCVGLDGRRALKRPKVRSAQRIEKKARLERLFTNPRFFKMIGRTGGRAYAKSHTPKERSMAASRAARARWKRRRRGALSRKQESPL